MTRGSCGCWPGSLGAAPPVHTQPLLRLRLVLALRPRGREEGARLGFHSGAVSGAKERAPGSPIARGSLGRAAGPTPPLSALGLP